MVPRVVPDAAVDTSDPKTRNRLLDSYRKRVDAQTGSQPDKSFTRDQATILKRLSLHLQGL
jgi:hypothetical protein